jgi:hypothetical protein
MLGVDPNMIIAGEQVAKIRQARNQAMAAKEQSAALHQQSETARNLGNAPTGDGSNALIDIMNQFSGYGSPSPQQV